MKLTLWMNDFSCAMYTGNSTFRKKTGNETFLFYVKRKLLYTCKNLIN